MGNNTNVDEATRLYFDGQFSALKDLLEEKVNHTVEIQKIHSDNIKENAAGIVALQIEVGILKEHRKQFIIDNTNKPKINGNRIALAIGSIGTTLGLIYFIITQLS